MNTGAKELKSILEELDELKLPHMAAELEALYKQPAFVNIISVTYRFWISILVITFLSISQSRI